MTHALLAAVLLLVGACLVRCALALLRIPSRRAPAIAVGADGEATRRVMVVDVEWRVPGFGRRRGSLVYSPSAVAAYAAASVLCLVAAASLLGR